MLAYPVFILVVWEHALYPEGTFGIVTNVWYIRETTNVTEKSLGIGPCTRNLLLGMCWMQNPIGTHESRIFRSGCRRCHLQLRYVPISRREAPETAWETKNNGISFELHFHFLYHK